MSYNKLPIEPGSSFTSSQEYLDRRSSSASSNSSLLNKGGYPYSLYEIPSNTSVSSDTVHQPSYGLLHSEPAYGSDQGNEDGDLNGSSEAYDRIEKLENDKYIREYIPSLPWYKRPSVIFILPVYMAAAIETTMLPAVNLKLTGTILCQQLYDDSPGYESPQCKSVLVQTKLSELMTYGKIITGLSSLFIIPYLCKLSDRIGRRPVLLFVHYFLVLSIIITIINWNFKSYLNYKFLLIGSVFDGVANPIVVMNILSTYIADCIPEEKRTTALAKVFCGTTVGFILGPIIGNAVYTSTNKSVIAPFYACIALSITTTLIVWLVFPESVSKAAIERAQSKYYKECVDSQEEEQSWFRTRMVKTINTAIIQPYRDMLSILSVIKSPADRTNLINVVSIEVLFSVLAYGLDGMMINYIMYQLGASVEQLNLMIMVSALVRVISLGASPYIGAVLGYFARFSRSGGPLDKVKESKLQDIYLMRLANCLETLALVIMGFSNGNPYIAFVSFGMIGLGLLSRPSLLSMMIGTLPEGEVGKFMGSKGPFEILVSVLGSSILLTIYTFLVKLSESSDNDYTGYAFLLSAVFYSSTIWISYRFKV